MVETKLALVVAAGSAILAASPVEDATLGWTQLGVAGVSMGIVFWIVSKRDPRVAEINAAAVRDAADKAAAAAKEAAQMHAESLREFHAELREENRRLYDLMIKALHTTPPGQ